MPSLRPNTHFPIISTACISLVVLASCVIDSDAFSTCQFTSLNRILSDVQAKHARRSQRLSMVAQMPTSNVTLDEMMLANTVMVDDVDMNDAKYDDEEDETEDLSTVDTMEIKRRLLDFVPRMMGTPEDYNTVETYVNILEDRYTPVQTLDFLNLAMSGEWQLLFSTNLGRGPTLNFRLRELFQKIEPNNMNGTYVNQAKFDFAEDYEGMTPATSHETSGTFSIKCSYSINQGSRMILNLDDHVIKLSKGSKVPKSVDGLVRLLYRAVPTELFDPNEHAMDTTYLDGDLRIVRMTGINFEGVRDIFIRRGSLETNPV
mmetsp:Transcript_9223/g.19359  ORF Transcript_9223/g.19359 Transcript_9223/m.19359 type:complete len:317 (-) Transcript_9223:508-1458(-)